jgi:hypothetical protein
MAGGMAQIVECLPCKCKARSSIPSTAKTNKQKKIKKKKSGRDAKALSPHAKRKAHMRSQEGSLCQSGRGLTETKLTIPCPGLLAPRTS